MREILVEAGVTPDEKFPKLIEKIKLKKSSLTPYWELTFSEPEVRFPLNQGSGFRTFHHGLCQEAKALLFSSPFSFYIKRLKNGNTKAYKFDNVDIEGVFGTRGIIDIDLNYVSLVSLVFIRNSALGLVEGRVAEKEFVVNKHSWILKTINPLLLQHHQTGD